MVPTCPYSLAVIQSGCAHLPVSPSLPLLKVQVPSPAPNPRNDGTARVHPGHEQKEANDAERGGALVALSDEANSSRREPDPTREEEEGSQPDLDDRTLGTILSQPFDVDGRQRLLAAVALQLPGQ